MGLGAARGWGRNNMGQLGDGTIVDALSPVQVSGLTNIIVIAAGGEHSVALTSDGVIWTWGDNVDGQLGDGTLNQSLVPITVMP